MYDRGGAPLVLKEDGSVLQETEYYAFGLPVLRTGNDAVNKYQYNGKEKQPETGWQDYGARQYMPEIGRWGTVDPLAEIAGHLSVYSYVADNPMRFIDPDGMRVRETDDRIVYTENDAKNKFREIQNGSKSEQNKRVILLGGANLSINGAGISNETKDILSGVDKSKTFDVKAYNHPYCCQTDASFIKDVVENVTSEYKEGQSIIFYGYSKGGELALRISRELEKKGIPISSLVTVDVEE